MLAMFIYYILLVLNLGFDSRVGRTSLCVKFTCPPRGFSPGTRPKSAGTESNPAATLNRKQW